jgi:lipopolysaccharide transport system ATP-binding protein
VKTTPAILFDQVSKKFRRGERHDTLRDLLPATVRRLLGGAPRTALQDGEFWAVRDVSFSLGPGEALGIIGPNGAGKSTILKLLSRVLRPTHGQCRIHGRVGALIEVAAAFHPDLTGRENLFLQGAIMGMSRQEIARKLDAIVAFSGISEFIDTPVKRYSSGMNARLGFSIAAHLDPDVLLIDEVLSVGDAGFQQQCVDHMRGLLAGGIPLVFVSHNLPAVLELCTRVIVIDHGAVRFDGEPAAAIAEYRRTPSANQRPAGQASPGGISISGVQLLDERRDDMAVFRTSSPLTVRIEYEAERPRQAHFAVDIYSADGVYCAGINTRMDRREFGLLSGAGFVELVIPTLSLLPGCYVVSAGILDAEGVRPLDVRHRAFPFSVASDCRDLGLVRLERSWRQEALPAHRPADAADAAQDLNGAAAADGHAVPQRDFDAPSDSLAPCLSGGLTR